MPETFRSMVKPGERLDVVSIVLQAAANGGGFFMDMAYFGKMALGLEAYIRNLPDEIEERLRGEKGTFPLQRHAYAFEIPRPVLR